MRTMFSKSLRRCRRSPASPRISSRSKFIHSLIFSNELGCLGDHAAEIDFKISLPITFNHLPMKVKLLDITVVGNFLRCLWIVPQYLPRRNTCVDCMPSLNDSASNPTVKKAPSRPMFKRSLGA
jgi:hypothetical protein